MYKNFSLYKPEDPAKKQLSNQFDVAFLKSEDGHDWYELIEKFKKDTWKLVICPKTSLILGYSKDPHMIFPEGAHVAEVDQIPEDIYGKKSWMFKEGEIVAYEPSEEEVLQNFETTKKSLLKEASEVLQPLTIAEDLGMQTKKEATLSNQVKKYIVLLSRTVVGDQWPKKPF